MIVPEVRGAGKVCRSRYASGAPRLWRGKLVSRQRRANRQDTKDAERKNKDGRKWQWQWAVGSWKRITAGSTGSAEKSDHKNANDAWCAKGMSEVVNHLAESNKPPPTLGVPLWALPKARHRLCRGRAEPPRGARRGCDLLTVPTVRLSAHGEAFRSGLFLSKRIYLPVRHPDG